MSGIFELDSQAMGPLIDGMFPHLESRLGAIQTVSMRWILVSWEMSV